MSLRIVRNDITKMQCDAIVNTANRHVAVGDGCDRAVYKAAGHDQLLAARREIGELSPGQAAITPGFDLPARFIIHAVSPLFVDGKSGEEELLRECYRNSLKLALENGIKSIAFPLISTGSFGYPREEGLRIALDEINDFLISHEMEVTIVVFGESETRLASRIEKNLEEYIDENYVQEKTSFEYEMSAPEICFNMVPRKLEIEMPEVCETVDPCPQKDAQPLDYDRLEKALAERVAHASDTFSEYLLYLIEQRGLKNVDVYTRAVIDKKRFSKIKNDRLYHPSKIVALQLCVGTELNIDQTKDLLARAGYALSPCDMTDIVFSYFIENKIYDVVEIDIQLENLGLDCIIK